MHRLVNLNRIPRFVDTISVFLLSVFCTMPNTRSSPPRYHSHKFCIESCVTIVIKVSFKLFLFAIPSLTGGNHMIAAHARRFMPNWQPPQTNDRYL